MTRRQWLHLPLVGVWLVLIVPGILVALAYRGITELTDYLHRVYRPVRHYSEMDEAITLALRDRLMAGETVTFPRSGVYNFEYDGFGGYDAAAADDLLIG